VTTPRMWRCPRSVTTGPTALVLAAAVWVVAGSAGHRGAPKAAAPEQRKAEKPYALIYGTVFGPDNRTVYGVKVKIRRADEKKARWELYSDHRGEFAQRVPAGRQDYVIWADLKGYKSPDGKRLQLVQEVTIHIDNEERSDTSLHLK
jgi:hypothetical protein